MNTHQYIDRESGHVLCESLFGDRIITYLYSSARENAGLLFKAATGSRFSKLLGMVNYDLPFTAALMGNGHFLQQSGIHIDECLEAPAYFTTPRKVFERKIRYWECRPLPRGEGLVVSPADAKVLLGSFAQSSSLFIKEKFFHFEELLGAGRRHLKTFQDGDFAIFRLTPDKYHYNHAPVSGRVMDIYEISGAYHSCNPTAAVEMVTPHSKNKRVVTLIDTDVDGGTGIGQVAMIEVAALMIGEIIQCYSAEKYNDPQPVKTGLFIKAGQVKSLYRPGSSTDILIFEKGRTVFAGDLLANQSRGDVQSRFSVGFKQPLAETDVHLRSLIAAKAD